jgi:ribosomal protein S12 methylthiotransferase
VDSEHLAGRLDEKQFSVVHDSPKKSDIVIINTCGFIGDAKEESVETILSFADARKSGKISKLIVMGCLSERYKSQLEAEIHEVDAFMGVNDINKIVEMLQNEAVNEQDAEVYHYRRNLSTPKHYAYLKISEGCDRVCSFCAIPLIRGKHRSVPKEDLLREADYLAKAGVKELILIAQDLTYYGLDLYGKREIVSLVEALAQIPGIAWIRLQYGYPHGFPLELVDLIQHNSKVCKYIDLPLQHISNRILKSMKRNLDKSQTTSLVDTIRERIPGVAFRTTFIVGYPGETEEEFEELYDFIKQQKFERLGVFAYSPEEDTAASSLADDVPDDVKQQRIARIMELQQLISLENNQKLVNTFQTVLIDRQEGEYYIGRTQYDSPEVDNEVLIPFSSSDLQIGDFLQLRIVSADFFDLYAEVLEYPKTT